jgi:mannose-6-phosphate isomerase
VLFAEVQQTSDATFRLFDWDRKDASGATRKLHVEEALACIDWKAGPVKPIRGCGEGSPAPRQLLKGPFFCLEHARLTEPAVLGGGKMQIVVVLHGRGVLATERGREPLTPGETLLLPAALGPAWYEPEGVLDLLLAALPGGAGAAVSQAHGLPFATRNLRK